MERASYLLKTFLVAGLLTGAHSMWGQATIATVFTDLEPTHVVSNPSTNQAYVLNRCGVENPCSDNAVGTVTVIDGVTFSTHRVVADVTTIAMAINAATNKVYVLNQCGNDFTCSSPGTVTVIDGNTLATQTVTAGLSPRGIAVDSTRNKIYVVNADNTMTVVDGGTLGTQSVPTPSRPYLVAVNPVTNQIYVANFDGTATIFDGATFATHTVTAGSDPVSLAVNTVTNTAYIADGCPDGPPCHQGEVAVVSGNTFTSQLVPAGYHPIGLAINNATNKVYVVNNCGDADCQVNGSMTVLDGSTLATQDVALRFHPFAIDLNTALNRIYVSGNSYCQNCFQGYFYIIDGVTLGMFPVAIGSGPDSMAVDATRNRIYVGNGSLSSASIVDGGAKLQFESMAPCRLLDTRQTHNPIVGGTSQDFAVPQLGGCNVPATALVYSLNVTVVPHQALGYLTIWPFGQYQPASSTLNSLDGRIKANAAMVMAGGLQEISIYASDTTDLILDINGYFVPAGAQTDEFYSLPPCRVVDTRKANDDLGGPYLAGLTQRNFPVTESACVPQGQNIKAYSLNFTAVPHTRYSLLGYLTVWPEGGSKPVVSTLNNPTGTIVANAAIVPAGDGGGISVYPDQDTDLVIDINGYFAPPGQGGLSLYPAAPCRVLDTRANQGQPFVGERTLDIADGDCPAAIPTVERNYVFNATVVPPEALGYLTLWPDGQPRPLASTLNAPDGFITSNMAIVPTTNGSIDAYADELTQLVLDIAGFFAP